MSYEREQLDWLFRTDCPQCGDDAGWTGETCTAMGQKALVMACPRCGNECEWASGRMQKQLKSSPPTFTPGRQA